MGVTERLRGRICELTAENERLKKMVDWLAEKACQCTEASKQGGYCSYADDCFICIQNRNMPTPNDWREAAERAIKCQMK